ncbi:hypothetical protein [Paenibacillus pectinilyticus]|uniref:hypothetical protein n=1 Tax=Paenibacillus pectinilyticus TaxID=512399 RepID=UPI001428C9E3|nr:hypothetical protein [Paenibacillus pectinilyticus]
MRQSIKEKAITAPVQQLFHNSLAERLSQMSAFADVEISAEFTSDQEKMKSIPKKSYR